MQRALLRAARQAQQYAANTDASAAFASTKRAYSSAFASAGGSEAALCDPLAAIPARVRTFMNGHRLETALTQLAKLDASAKVRSAVEGARVMYQRRIASIRTELLRDKAAICHGQISAPRFVTLCNGLLASNGGRKVMLVGIPLAAAVYASTDHAICESVPAPYVPHLLRATLDAEHRLLISRSLDALAEEVLTVLRALYLLMLFLPVVATAPLCIGLGHQRDQWIQLVRWTLERAGPAFIKWGQWAATRPDMFPQDLCDSLAVLQTDSPQHRWDFTRRAVENAFGHPISVVFSEFSHKPVASGSIAQIHKATLSEWGADKTGKPAGTVVAVKVRHPGVSTVMQRDFVLMQRAAALSTRMPILRDLNLQESVRQFGAPLREQLDLSSEAQNLARFNRNFRKWKNLSFPEPIYPLVAPDVLVESFEEGQLISRYVNSPSNPHNTKLAAIGLDSYLKMLLKDNFIHADLHPGNILVRMDRPDPTSYWGRLAARLDLGSPEHMVLLDVGMVAELTREDQANLVQFFKAISHKDGRALGENILGFSDERQTCPAPELFVAQMTEYFDNLSWARITADTSAVIGDMMELVRQHQVSLKGVVSTVVVTTLVLEGWSSKLNPDIRILEKLQDLLPLSWPERTQRFISEFGSDREVAI